MSDGARWMVGSRILIAGAAVGAIAWTYGGAVHAQSWGDIVKAAEQEGEVVVIAPPVKEHRETISEFSKAYPNIKLKVTGMASGDWEPRLAAERKSGSYIWDAMVTGVSLTVYTKLIPEGWFDSINAMAGSEVKRDELWLAGWQSGFMDKAGKHAYAFAGGISNNWMIDRSQVTEAQFNSFEDLLKPELKGKIAMYDPRIRGPGGFTLAQAAVVLGEEKIRKFLTTQDVVITSTLRQLVEWSVRGSYPIVIGAAPANIQQYQEQGIGLSVKPLVLPPSATAIGPAWGVVLAFTRAPHPNATKVFVNWMLSKEAQSDWAGRGKLNSRRLDVAKGQPELAPTAEMWKTGLQLSGEAFVEPREKFTAIAIEALKK